MGLWTTTCWGYEAWRRLLAEIRIGFDQTGQLDVPEKSRGRGQIPSQSLNPELQAPIIHLSGILQAIGRGPSGKSSGIFAKAAKVSVKDADTGINGARRVRA
jgi:hypothetical protein